MLIFWINLYSNNRILGWKPEKQKIMKIKEAARKYSSYSYLCEQTTTLNVQDNTVLKDANTHWGVDEQKWRSRSSKDHGTNRILVQTEEKCLLYGITGNQLTKLFHCNVSTTEPYSANTVKVLLCGFKGCFRSLNLIFMGFFKVKMSFSDQ